MFQSFRDRVAQNFSEMKAEIIEIRKEIRWAKTKRQTFILESDFSSRKDTKKVDDEESETATKTWNKPQNPHMRNKSENEKSMKEKVRMD